MKSTFDNCISGLTGSWETSRHDFHTRIAISRNSTAPYPVVSDLVAWGSGIPMDLWWNDELRENSVSRINPDFSKWDSSKLSGSRTMLLEQYVLYVWV